MTAISSLFSNGKYKKSVNYVKPISRAMIGHFLGT